MPNFVSVHVLSMPLTHNLEQSGTKGGDEDTQGLKAREYAEGAEDALRQGGGKEEEEGGQTATASRELKRGIVVEHSFACI
jgi:hypothetical protein